MSDLTDFEFKYLVDFNNECKMSSNTMGNYSNGQSTTNPFTCDYLESISAYIEPMTSTDHIDG